MTQYLDQDDPNVALIYSSYPAALFVDGMYVGNVDGPCRPYVCNPGNTPGGETICNSPGDCWSNDPGKPLLVKVPSFPFRLTAWQLQVPGWCSRNTLHYLVQTKSFTIGIPGIPPGAPAGYACMVDDPPIIGIEPTSIIASSDPMPGGVSISPLVRTAAWEPGRWAEGWGRFRYAPFLTLMVIASASMGALWWYERRRA